MKRLILCLALLCAGLTPAFAYDVIVQKSSGLPVTTFNVTFRVGSADDPKAAEGLANMTAQMLREGGVRAYKGLPARTRAQVEEFLFPYAADINVSVGREQISFTATSSAADSEAIFELMTQMILAPAFDKDELERLRSEELDALQKQFPREDQEELGKHALERQMWGKGHPYSHVVNGTVASVKAMTLAQVKAFYVNMFTRKRLTVGVAGVVPKALENKIKTVFSPLEQGESAFAKIPPAQEQQGARLLIVKGPFEATGVHLGDPVGFNRASPEFGQMYLMALGFGKHRSFVGRLMKNVREIRSLNYGAYAYVEEFPGGGHSLIEPTQAARTRQAFTVWGRPTTLENGCFLTRQLHREVESLVKKGLTEGEFQLAQSHLIGNAPLLAVGIERRLGYAIDSKFYGIKGDYIKQLQKSAKAATCKSVHRWIKKHIDPAKLDIVVVTPDPKKFKEQILSPRCDITYAAGSKKDKTVLAEDQKIAVHSLRLKPEDIVIVDSEELF